ncbi:MAG: hypothetical protein WDN00_06230 [Limisphaerales bacterium]
MVETTDPNKIIAGLGVAILALGGLWRLGVWFRDAPVKPDPWSAEIEASLQREDATPVCHRCLNPHSNAAWFCDIVAPPWVLITIGCPMCMFFPRAKF